MEDMLRTIAIARLILGPQMNLQAPPNLSYADFPRLLEAGINDWGGISPVTKDFINPEAAWPQIAKLRSETEARGFTLREQARALSSNLRRSGNFLSAQVRRTRATSGRCRRLCRRVAATGLMLSRKHENITALAGGVGASKLLLGLYDVIDPRDLTVIVNTGDDITLHGLKISPDLDIVTYTLAGIVDDAKGWGYRGETFHALKRLAAFGRINWFNLGDRDLATHIHRSAMLAEGKSLSDAAEAIRLALGVEGADFAYERQLYADTD